MSGTDFRKWVEERRKAAGTQVALALKWGVTDRTIRDYIDGTARPSGRTATRIAKAEGVRVQWVLLGQGPKDEPHLEAPPGPGYALALNRKLLEVCMRAVEARLGSLSVEVRAGLIIHCYEHLRNSPEETWLESAKTVVDLMASTGSVSHKEEPRPEDVGQPISSEAPEEIERQRITKGK